MGALCTCVKTCTRCNEYKPISEFPTRKHGRDGLDARCRDCKKEIRRQDYLENRNRTLAVNAAWAERNRERTREYQREWYQRRRTERYEHVREIEQRHEAKRRARKMAVKWENVSREYIIERDQSVCHICKKRVPANQIHLDHLVPLSKGGSHTADNLAVSHAHCNMSRRAGRLPAQLRLMG